MSELFVVKENIINKMLNRPTKITRLNFRKHYQPIISNSRYWHIFKVESDTTYYAVCGKCGYCFSCSMYNENNELVLLVPEKMCKSCGKRYSQNYYLDFSETPIPKNLWTSENLSYMDLITYCHKQNMKSEQI